MTLSEFNEKYKDYLVDGHHGMDLEIPEAIELVDSLFDEYIKSPHFKYMQVKAKFHWGRIYCTGIPPSIVHKAEEELTNIIIKHITHDKTNNSIQET